MIDEEDGGAHSAHREQRHTGARVQCAHVGEAAQLDRAAMLQPYLGRVHWVADDHTADAGGEARD